MKINLSLKENMNQTLWLYIWRFQPFHNGHKSIIDRMIQENEQNLILIGVSDSYETTENPYSYTQRLGFMSDTYQDETNIAFWPLIDNDSDKKWVQQILWIWYIQKVKKIQLYCWSIAEDSAIKVIKQYENLFTWKQLDIIEIDRNIVPISGTQVRHEMKTEWVESIENLVPNEVYDSLKKTG